MEKFKKLVYAYIVSAHIHLQFSGGLITLLENVTTISADIYNDLCLTFIGSRMRLSICLRGYKSLVHALLSLFNHPSLFWYLTLLTPFWLLFCVFCMLLDILVFFIVNSIFFCFSKTIVSHFFKIKVLKLYLSITMS